MTDPLRLRVGEHYESGVRRWPGQELILTSSGCLIVLDYVAPTPDEIDDFETADAYFAWIEARHNGILCCRIGTRWHFLPFNPHRDTPPTLTSGMPEVATEHYLPVPIGLANVDISPVEAIRVVDWPEHFVSAMRATVARLGAQPFDPDQTASETNALYGDVGVERLAERAVVSAVSPGRRHRSTSTGTP